MCGICGLASPDGAAGPNPAILQAMSATMVHRGPDSDGLIVEGPVGLAARRLSIIDLARGSQPISNEDQTVHVVQNGEIYNYAQLREQLAARGHTFATHCDTEVLVHLYEERGERFVDDLRGMFAIAIWDFGRRRLVLARDRFGIKPLYYAPAGGGLSFASELDALLAQPGFPTELDPDALEAYLAFNSVPAPLTIYRAARKLPPGHLLIWSPGDPEPRIARYARPAPAAKDALVEGGISQLAEVLRERMRDSVRAHLVADVPVGVLLSGGIDSSALAAFATEQSGKRISTFSIGFEERSFDELEQARRVARRYETDHHELVLRPDAAELLPEVVRAFDEPFADSSALPTYLVSRLASQHVKVSLSGEGGDELFGGYYTYVADLIAPRVGPLAAALRPVIDRLPSSSRRTSVDYMAKRFARGASLPPLERHHAWKEIFSADARAELIGSVRDGARDPLELWRARYQETEGAEALARLQDIDIGLYLADDLLTKTDRASMAHSLEVRVPFLDTAVTDLALALPTRLKVRGLTKKRLLREAVKPLLPKEIVRGRKRGFSIPAAAWLRGDLEPFARDVLSPERVARPGDFDPAAVTKVIDAHVEGREDLSRQIWGLLSFSLWYDGQTAAGTAARAAN